MTKNSSGNKTPRRDKTRLLEKSFRVLHRFRTSQRALRESNLYLETILTTARAGMWVWDLKEEWQTSPGLNLLFGRAEDDLPLRLEEFSSFIHPDDLLRVSDAWQRTVQAHDPYEQEYRIIWPDGSVHWLTSRGSILKTSSGVTQFVGITFDITERKKSEEALQESENKFKDLVEKSNAGVYLIQGRIHRYVNAKLAEIHGYDPDEMIDRLGPEHTIHPDDWAASLESMRLRDSGVRSQYRQFRIVRKDGEVRDVEVYGSQTTYQGKPAIIGTMLDITERKQAEEALQREKDRLAAVLNSIQDDIRVIDINNRIILANPVALVSLGSENLDNLEYPDLMSRVDVRTLDGQKMTFENAPSQRALKGIVVKQEEQIVRNQTTGEEKYKEVSSSPVKDPSGNIVGAVIVVRDITERKQAEVALKASEEQFRRAMEDAPIPTIMQSEDGEVLQLSHTWTELTGYTIEDIRTFDEWTTRAVYGEGADTVRDHLRKLFSGRIGPIDLEFTIHTMGGEERYWSFSASSPGTLSDGRRFVVGMANDITERKRAEEDLRESEERYRGVVTNTSAVILRIDPQLVIRYANPRALEFFGYSDDELIGRNVLGTIVPERETTGRDLKAMLEAIAANPNRFYSNANENMRKNNERVWMKWTNSGVYDSAGKLKEFLSVGIDDTERKNAEQELRRSRDELEERVQERTKQLRHAYEELQVQIRNREETEERLRQSQKMEAIGTLAGGIAHDFNNILAGMIGFAEMALEDTQDQPHVQKSLTRVLQSTKRAKDLVRQILTFSRKSDYKRNPVSVTPIIQETIQLLRATIPATIRIEFQTTARSDTVIASPTEIQQILVNLATNASMAMEAKGGVLEISLSEFFHSDNESLSGEYLQITVKDTGVGMTREVMQKVFDPFFTTREPGKGTGMGLAVVYGIVRNLNGEITVSSVPGQGSTFSVLLPKTQADLGTDQDTLPEIQGGNETILYVEDEEMLNEWGKTVLEKLGYTVHAFRDPEDALKAFSKNPSVFDLVITDQAMPNMAGSELASKIHTLRVEIPILLSTGYQEPITTEKVEEIGIDEILSKPMAKNELAAAVRRTLDHKKVASRI